jgi:tRNA(Arg) A34 adenosine deaminase TadA
MRAAIAEAKAAAKEGNAPIGAVIAKNNRIIESGRNKVFTSRDITAHAEVVAIRKLTRRMRRFDLKDYELFTTFVPCAMCTATILRVNIHRVIYGAEAEDAPQFSKGIHQKVNNSVYAIARSRVRFTGGVLREECARVLQHAKPD